MVAFARREEDADANETMARDLLVRFGSIQRLSDADFPELKEKTSQDDFEILRAKALLELGRRAEKAGKGVPDTIDTAEDAMAHLDFLRGEKREHLYAFLLDAKNQLIRLAEIHIGTLTMSLVGPREIFREAIKEGACNVVVAHNHPSGDPTPSPEDIDVTKKLVEIGELLDIKVLDHVIIGDGRAVSLNRMRLM